jgi:hypothetical protein
MSRELDAALRRQIREDRGTILDILLIVHPEGILEDDLLDAMLEQPRPVDRRFCRRDVGRMQRFGLIEFVSERNDAGRTVIRWYITSDGIAFVGAGKNWDALEEANG